MKPNNEIPSIDEPGPIRTVEDFKASAAEWEAATMYSTSGDDPEIIQRANAVIHREEARMDEARHLFEFDEEGDLVGLAGVLTVEKTIKLPVSATRMAFGNWIWFIADAIGNHIAQIMPSTDEDTCRELAQLINEGAATRGPTAKAVEPGPAFVVLSCRDFEGDNVEAVFYDSEKATARRDYLREIRHPSGNERYRVEEWADGALEGKAV